MTRNVISSHFSSLLTAFGQQTHPALAPVSSNAQNIARVLSAAPQNPFLQKFSSDTSDLCAHGFRMPEIPSTLSRVQSGLQASTSFSSASTTSLAVPRRNIFSFTSGTTRGEGKKYNERRLLGYSPEQMLNVIVDVDHYHLFVPWCRSSKVLVRKGPSYFEAELEVGFQLFNERYTSKVSSSESPHPRVVCRVDNSQLFYYLDNLWELKPGPTPQSCWVSLQVDFEFKNPLYRQVATLFLDEVVKRMIVAFEGRCRVLYGAPYGRGAGQIGATTASTAATTNGALPNGGAKSPPLPGRAPQSRLPRAGTPRGQLDSGAQALDSDREVMGTDAVDSATDDRLVRR